MKNTQTDQLNPPDFASTNAWPDHLLQLIVATDDLRVAPWREDGRTLGTPTWVWCVAVGGGLYVRAYHGTGSRWFQAARRQQGGCILAAGTTWPVRFETFDTPTTAALASHLDDAYRTKYASSPYLSSMVSERARHATVRIYPKD